MLNRREAIRSLTAGVVTAGIARARVRDRSEPVAVAVIGCGRRGRTHVRLLTPRSDVRIVCVCDRNRAAAGRAAAGIRKRTGRRPVVVTDIRHIPAACQVDAVIVAVSAQAQAAAASFAVDAGWHVYLEAPFSGTVPEGRRLLQQASACGTVVQVGCQSRSSPHVVRAMRLIRDGAVGTVCLAVVWSSRGDRMGSADRTGRHSVDGAGFEHDLDLGLWGLGVDERHPESVTVTAKPSVSRTDGRAIDVTQTTFDYAPADAADCRRQLVVDHASWTPWSEEGSVGGAAFYGTDGFLIVGRDTHFRHCDRKGRPVEEVRAAESDEISTRNHVAAFLDCVQSGRRPGVELLQGHHCATVRRLGWMAASLNRTLFFDGDSEQVTGDPQACQLLAARIVTGSTSCSQPG